MDKLSFRTNVLELKDFTIRSVLELKSAQEGFEYCQLARNLNDFVSGMKEIDAIAEKHVLDYFDLQKAWLKRDFSTLAKLNEIIYKKRKDIFYELLFRVVSPMRALLI